MTTMLEKYNLLIGNETVPASDGKYFDSCDPSDATVFVAVANATKDDMCRAIDNARQAFDRGQWSRLTPEERGKYLSRISELIRDHAKDLAELESRDTGKTIKQTTFIDVPTCAQTFEYFSKIKNELDSKKNNIAAPVESIVRREPLGVVGCIIPWNYPLIMAAWKIAPALITGNTVILKPSSKASASVMHLAKLLTQADLPSGVLQIISSQNHEGTEELIRNEKVDKISFTGGTTTGQKVMQWASGNTKRLTLELGGKSPNIVFDDCHFDAALGATMSAIFMNQGQMCTAGSRLLLQDKIYTKFMDALVQKTKKIKIGPALNHETDFGPIISKEHRDNLLVFIDRGIKEGAKLLCGGKIPANDDCQDGYYLEPTILGDVTNEMFVAQEEAFGPVLCVIKFSDEAEAIHIANDSRYGLAACVWTEDNEKARRVAQQLHCGTVWINTYGGFYDEAPYGGYKQSGFGRELGLEGLLEYTQTKHICIDQTPGGQPLVAHWF